jgi:hypothetical protein
MIPRRTTWPLAPDVFREQKFVHDEIRHDDGYHGDYRDGIDELGQCAVDA